MSATAQTKKRQFRAFQAFTLAAFSCVFGLLFCLVKSPQARSEAYLAMAVEALAQSHTHEAAAAAFEAVRLNPAASEGWRILSKMLQENSQGHAAKQAMVIATRLQKNPGQQNPLYAMPAELRLSFLASGGTENP
jgi:cytochrome c-type biogenesis protein CcmH/NrfG